MDEGKRELNNVLLELEILATDNPCKASDKMLLLWAKSLRALIHTKVRAEVCLDRAASLCSLSVRQFRRLVERGEVPEGHNDGKRWKTWYVDELPTERIHKRTDCHTK